MNCDERTRLLRILHGCTMAHSKAVRELSQNIGICALNRYERYQKACDATRLDMDDAKKQLEAHIEEHRCMKLPRPT